MKFLVLLAGGLGCIAAERVAMEKGVLVSDKYTNWVGQEVADADKSSETMTVYFMMKHNPADVETLKQTLYDVSDPRSEKYGQHLSLKDLKELTPISADAQDAVATFLSDAGVTEFKTNHNADIVSATVTLEQAETLFDTEILNFQHTDVNAELYRASKPYSLPEEVADVVSFVGDLVRVPSMQGAKIVPPSKLRGDKGANSDWPNSCTGLGAACKNGVNPAVLEQRYNITDSYGDREVAAQNSFAVAEFQGQYYDNKDITKFNDGCSTNVTVDNVVGKDIQEGGVEAMLDVEYIGALSPEIPLTFYYQAEYSLLKWAEGLSNDESAPYVHSVSYGNDEIQQTGAEYIFSCATQFMKLGTRGLSILFASGDQGVCGRSGCGLIRHTFHPDFPAACPYITAVGGTDFNERGVIGDEKAWTDGGGGFSNYFDIPSFQTDVVAAYKSDASANLPPQHMWNNTGRGYPDVSALGGEGNPYCVQVDGSTSGVAGTSASCPVTASIFARLNGIRLAAGKAPLGWLNPFIYQNADAFNDVSEGKNSGGGIGGYGFQAIKGWDPATGVGTPNFGLLAEAVEALP